VLLISTIEMLGGELRRTARRLQGRRRIRARVVRANHAGLVLELGPVWGFLPRWELRDPACADLDRLAGSTMRLYVIGTTSRHVLLSQLPPRARRRRPAR